MMVSFEKSELKPNIEKEIEEEFLKTFIHCELLI